MEVVDGGAKVARGGHRGGMVRRSIWSLGRESDGGTKLHEKGDRGR